MVDISRNLSVGLAASTATKGADQGSSDFEAMLGVQQDPLPSALASGPPSALAIRPPSDVAIWSPDAQGAQMLNYKASALKPESNSRETALYQPSPLFGIHPNLSPLNEHQFSTNTFNEQPAGKAASVFHNRFQERVLREPGSVQASRADLGINKDHLVMVDVGGEGQKTSLDGLKSGSAHAININTQNKISSVPIGISFEPYSFVVPLEEGKVPNLVRPAHEWPSSPLQVPGRFLPLEDRFSNLTLLEGAPLTTLNVREMARITHPNGWMVLNVDQQFEPQVRRLAELHNGGEVSLSSPEKGMHKALIPPRGLANESRAALYRDLHEASSHEIYDLISRYSPELSV